MKTLKKGDWVRGNHRTNWKGEEGEVLEVRTYNSDRPRALLRMKGHETQPITLSVYKLDKIAPPKVNNR